MPDGGGMHCAVAHSSQGDFDVGNCADCETYCATADTIAGNGTQRGYFVNQHQNGDRDDGTFEGTVTTANGAMSAEGTWQLTGGTACSSV
jgi:hypothetical protein